MDRIRAGRPMTDSRLPFVMNLPDVYADTPLNRPYDAILDVFPALQPMPTELPGLRLRLAGNRGPL